MFAPIYPPAIGGPATQCRSLCRALIEKGVGVTVITPGERFGVTHADGYPVYRYRWDYTGTWLDKVIRWFVFTGVFLYVFLRTRPDIMHAHSISASSFIAGFISRLFRTPTVIKFAGDWVWETLSTSGVKAHDFTEIYKLSTAARIMLKVERLGLSFFNVIWAPSQFRRENARAVLGTDHKVRVIPNSLLLPAAEVRQEASDDPFVVVSANRFIPHKQIPTIVRAFAAIEHTAKRLVLIGDGQESERAKVEEEIRRLGIEDKVQLTGRLASKEVYGVFSTSSVYVSASLEEGFPNVFIEAMHFGLPIVSTDVGGCREMVIEDKTGFLIDAGDEVAMTDRLQRFADNRQLRNDFALAAHEEASKYDLTVVVDQFIDMYRSIQRP